MVNFCNICSTLIDILLTWVYRHCFPTCSSYWLQRPRNFDSAFCGVLLLQFTSLKCEEIKIIWCILMFSAAFSPFNFSPKFHADFLPFFFFYAINRYMLHNIDKPVYLILQDRNFSNFHFGLNSVWIYFVQNQNSLTL